MTNNANQLTLRNSIGFTFERRVDFNKMKADNDQLLIITKSIGQCFRRKQYSVVSIEKICTNMTQAICCYFKQISS